MRFDGGAAGLGDCVGIGTFASWLVAVGEELCGYAASQIRNSGGALRCEAAGLGDLVGMHRKSVIVVVVRLRI